MRHVVTVCIAVTIIALTSVSAGRAHAEGGTDPVYAHLNAQQKHTYDQLYSEESDSENCYGIGRDGYNAYLAWAVVCQTRNACARMTATPSPS